MVVNSCFIFQCSLHPRSVDAASLLSQGKAFLCLTLVVSGPDINNNMSFSVYKFSIKSQSLMLEMVRVFVWFFFLDESRLTSLHRLIWSKSGSIFVTLPCLSLFPLIDRPRFLGRRTAFSVKRPRHPFIYALRQRW